MKKIYGFTATSAADGTRMFGIERWKWSKLGAFLLKQPIKSRNPSDIRISFWFFSIVLILACALVCIASFPGEIYTFADQASLTATKLRACVEQTGERTICRAAFISNLPDDYSPPIIPAKAVSVQIDFGPTAIMVQR